jgi:hypothetical protein
MAKSIIQDPPLPKEVLRGSAGAVDTLVRVGQPNTRSEIDDLKETLRGLNPAIDNYLKLQAAQAKTNEQLGAIHAVMGKAPDRPSSFMNLGWGYGAGYSLTDGEMRGVKIRQEYEQRLLSANYFADEVDSDTAKRKREELLKSVTDKWLQGTTNVAVLTGASNHVTKGALDGEAKAFERFHEVKTGKLINNVRASLEPMIRDLKAGFLHYKAAGKEVPEAIAVRARETLSGVKRLLQANGLSPQQAATTIIDIYGQSVSDMLEGTQFPTLAMDLMKVLRATDDSGFNWYNYAESKDGQQVFPYRQQIEHMENALRNKLHETYNSNSSLKKAKKEQAEMDLEYMITVQRDPQWVQKAAVHMKDGVPVNMSHLKSLWDNWSSTNFLGNVDNRGLVMDLMNYASRSPENLWPVMLKHMEKGDLTLDSAKLIYSITNNTRTAMATDRAYAQEGRALDIQEQRQRAERAKVVADEWAANAQVMYDNNVLTNDPLLKNLNKNNIPHYKALLESSLMARAKFEPNISMRDAELLVRDILVTARPPEYKAGTDVSLAPAAKGTAEAQRALEVRKKYQGGTNAKQPKQAPK